MSSETSYKDVAVSVWKRYRSHSPFRSYCTVLAMNGMARLSKIVGDAEMRAEIAECLQPFLKGEVPDVIGAYGKRVYRFGIHAGSRIYAGSAGCDDPFGGTALPGTAAR